MTERYLKSPRVNVRDRAKAFEAKQGAKKDAKKEEEAPEEVRKVRKKKKAEAGHEGPNVVEDATNRGVVQSPPEDGAAEAPRGVAGGSRGVAHSPPKAVVAEPLRGVAEPSHGVVHSPPKVDVTEPRHGVVRSPPEDGVTKSTHGVVHSPTKSGVAEPAHGVAPETRRGVVHSPPKGVVAGPPHGVVRSPPNVGVAEPRHGVAHSPPEGDVTEPPRGVADRTHGVIRSPEPLRGVADRSHGVVHTPPKVVVAEPLRGVADRALGVAHETRHGVVHSPPEVVVAEAPRGVAPRSHGVVHSPPKVDATQPCRGVVQSPPKDGVIKPAHCVVHSPPKAGVADSPRGVADRSQGVVHSPEPLRGVAYRSHGVVHSSRKVGVAEPLHGVVVPSHGVAHSPPKDGVAYRSHGVVHSPPKVDVASSPRGVSDRSHGVAHSPPKAGVAEPPHGVSDRSHGVVHSSHKIDVAKPAHGVAHRSHGVAQSPPNVDVAEPPRGVSDRSHGVAHFLPKDGVAEPLHGVAYRSHGVVHVPPKAGVAEPPHGVSDRSRGVVQSPPKDGVAEPPHGVSDRSHGVVQSPPKDSVTKPTHGVSDRSHGVVHSSHKIDVTEPAHGVVHSPPKDGVTKPTHGVSDRPHGVAHSPPKDGASGPPPEVHGASATDLIPAQNTLDLVRQFNEISCARPLAPRGHRKSSSLDSGLSEMRDVDAWRRHPRQPQRRPADDPEKQRAKSGLEATPTPAPPQKWNDLRELRTGRNDEDRERLYGRREDRAEQIAQLLTSVQRVKEELERCGLEEEGEEPSQKEGPEPQEGQPDRGEDPRCHSPRRESLRSLGSLGSLEGENLQSLESLRSLESRESVKQKGENGEESGRCENLGTRGLQNRNGERRSLLQSRNLQTQSLRSLRDLGNLRSLRSRESVKQQGENGEECRSLQRQDLPSLSLERQSLERRNLHGRSLESENLQNLQSLQSQSVKQQRENGEECRSLQRQGLPSRQSLERQSLERRNLQDLGRRNLQSENLPRENLQDESLRHQSVQQQRHELEEHKQCQSLQRRNREQQSLEQQSLERRNLQSESLESESPESESVQQQQQHRENREEHRQCRSLERQDLQDLQRRNREQQSLERRNLQSENPQSESVQQQRQGLEEHRQCQSLQRQNLQNLEHQNLQSRSLQQQRHDLEERRQCQSLPNRNLQICERQNLKHQNLEHQNLQHQNLQNREHQNLEHQNLQHQNLQHRELPQQLHQNLEHRNLQPQNLQNLQRQNLQHREQSQQLHQTLEEHHNRQHQNLQNLQNHEHRNLQPQNLQPQNLQNLEHQNLQHREQSQQLHQTREEHQNLDHRNLQPQNLQNLQRQNLEHQNLQHREQSQQLHQTLEEHQNRQHQNLQNLQNLQNQNLQNLQNQNLQQREDQRCFLAAGTQTEERSEERRSGQVLTTADHHLEPEWLLRRWASPRRQNGPSPPLTDDVAAMDGRRPSPLTTAFNPFGRLTPSPQPSSTAAAAAVKVHVRTKPELPSYFRPTLRKVTSDPHPREKAELDSSIEAILGELDFAKFRRGATSSSSSPPAASPRTPVKSHEDQLRELRELTEKLKPAISEAKQEATSSASAFRSRSLPRRRYPVYRSASVPQVDDEGGDATDATPSPYPPWWHVLAPSSVPVNATVARAAPLFDFRGFATLPRRRGAAPEEPDEGLVADSAPDFRSLTAPRSAPATPGSPRRTTFTFGSLDRRKRRKNGDAEVKSGGRSLTYPPQRRGSAAEDGDGMRSLGGVATAATPPFPSELSLADSHLSPAEGAGVYEATYGDVLAAAAPPEGGAAKAPKKKHYSDPSGDRNDLLDLPEFIAGAKSEPQLPPPAPAAPEGDARSPQRRYSKKRLRGPYGEMLEEEMRKSGEKQLQKLIIAEELSFLGDLAVEKREEEAEAPQLRPEAGSSRSLDEEDSLRAGSGEETFLGGTGGGDDAWNLCEVLDADAEDLESLLRQPQDTRTHVVAELYDTEKSYVESLHILINKYFRPLKSPEYSGLVDSTLVDEMFFEIPEILSHHETFLEVLKQRLENWDNKQKVGDVFVDSFTKQAVIDTYTAFINNWKTAKEAIKVATQAKPAFAKFLEHMSREHRGKLTLDALLIMPVQRIPRYELLIKELLKHTQVDHPDHRLLVIAQKEVHDLAVKINRMEREAYEAERMQLKLKEMEGMIEGLVDLVHPLRVFLRYELVTMSGSLGTKKERCLFLFSDLLIITSIKRKSGTIRRTTSSLGSPSSLQNLLETNKYKLLMRISLDDLDVARTNDANIKKVLKDIQQLEEDVMALNQINDLSASLNCPHQNLDEVVKEMIQSMSRQLQEKQTSDSQLLCLELTVTTQVGMETMPIIFSAPEKRATWEAAFHEAKQKLALSTDRRPPPEFMYPLPIRKTRAGLQFTCAAPTLGLNCHNLRDVWVCNSDGYVGQVCVLSLQPEPTVTSCNGVCNARILCITSIPATAAGAAEGPATHCRRSTYMDSKSGVSISIEDVDEDEMCGGNGNINIQLDSDSSEDEKDASSDCPDEDNNRKKRETSPTDETRQDEVDNQQPTMWLGTEDGCIHVYNCSDNIRIKKNKIKLQHSAAIHCILYLDGRVFISLANGDLSVYDRDQTGGGWETNEPATVNVGSSVAPVTRMIAVTGKLWCGCQNMVKIINIQSLEIECSFAVHLDANRPIHCMVTSGLGVWISVQNSSVIKLYHATSYETLLDVNVAPAVSKMLAAGCDDIIRQHKAACLRVTSLLTCKDLLWVGTSAGVVLNLALPHLTSATVKLTNAPNVSGIPHGHTGHVRFLTCVETTPSQDGSGLRGKYGHRSVKYKEGHSAAGRRASTSALGSNRLLVISGGDGYEDFRNTNYGEAAGRDDSTNHLLLWQV